MPLYVFVIVERLLCKAYNSDMGFDEIVMHFEFRKYMVKIKHATSLFKATSGIVCFREKNKMK
jgi:hypothetical protein